MRVVAVIAAAGLALIAAPAMAQPPDSLRGPAVQDKPAKATIVERDLKGKLKRPEVPPEESALALVPLDDQTKAAVEAVLSARAEVLDRVVLDNLDLVVKLHNARQSKDRGDQLAVMADFMKKLQPLNARGLLAQEIRGALGKERAATFDAILGEYRKAAIDEATTEARRRNEFVNARTLETRENLASLGLEIKRSYERQVGSKTAEFDGILAKLSLQPEQDAKIRSMVGDFTRETRGKATPEQKRSMFFRIMSQLDGDQQKRLVSLYLGHDDPGT